MKLGPAQAEAHKKGTSCPNLQPCTSTFRHRQSFISVPSARKYQYLFLFPQNSTALGQARLKSYFKGLNSEFVHYLACCNQGGSSRLQYVATGHMDPANIFCEPWLKDHQMALFEMLACRFVPLPLFQRYPLRGRELWMLYMRKRKILRSPGRTGLSLVEALYDQDLLYPLFEHAWLTPQDLQIKQDEPGCYERLCSTLR